MTNVAENLMAGNSGHGLPALREIPRPDKIEDDDIAKIEGMLTSPEAKAALREIMAQRRYFTKLDIEALRDTAEAAGNSRIYDRKVASLRDAGEDIPAMITRYEGDEEGGEEGKPKKGRTVQLLGVGTMARREQERFRQGAAMLGLSPRDRTKLLDVRQDTLPGFGTDEAQIPQGMTPLEAYKLATQH